MAYSYVFARVGLVGLATCASPLAAAFAHHEHGAELDANDLRTTRLFWAGIVAVNQAPLLIDALKNLLR